MLTPLARRHELAVHHRAAERSRHRRRRSRRSPATTATSWQTTCADALGSSDLLILTGGLGPTDDDLTRERGRRVIGLPLEDQARHLRGDREALRRARPGGCREINRRQAMVPRGRRGAAEPERHGAGPVDRARADADRAAARSAARDEADVRGASPGAVARAWSARRGCFGACCGSPARPNRTSKRRCSRSTRSGCSASTRVTTTILAVARPDRAAPDRALPRCRMTGIAALDARGGGCSTRRSAAICSAPTARRCSRLSAICCARAVGRSPPPNRAPAGL